MLNVNTHSQNHFSTHVCTVCVRKPIHNTCVSTYVYVKFTHVYLYSLYIYILIQHQPKKGGRVFTGIL